MRTYERTRRRRGQSLAEMAVVIPVLFFLLMGGFDATIMIADRVTAGSHLRQAAPPAGEVGWVQKHPRAQTPQNDMQIVHQAVPVHPRLTAPSVPPIGLS